MKHKKTIKCPLVNRTVDSGFCFETAVASEGLMIDHFWPKELAYNDELVKKCLTCPNHPD